jgi:hypothetical protein
MSIPQPTFLCRTFAILVLLASIPGVTAAAPPAGDLAQVYAQIFAPAGEAGTGEILLYAYRCCGGVWGYCCEPMTLEECLSSGGEAYGTAYTCSKWCQSCLGASSISESTVNMLTRGDR